MLDVNDATEMLGRHPDAIARLHLAAAVLRRLANNARGDEAGLDYPRVLLQEANRRPTS